MSSEPGDTWAAWLREQFDRHKTVRRAVDLVRASGVKANGRPVIDGPRVTGWLRGQRPSYDLTVVTARAFGAPVQEALVAAGYGDVFFGGEVVTVYEDGPRDSTHTVNLERPVGLGLDAAAADLAPEQVEAIRALIRSMKPPPEQPQ